MSPERETPARGNGVQVIGRAAEILRALHDVPEGMTLSQLAQAVGLAQDDRAPDRPGAADRGRRVTTPDGEGRVRLGPELGRLAAGTPAAIAWVDPPVPRGARAGGQRDDRSRHALRGRGCGSSHQVVPGRRLRATSIFGRAVPRALDRQRQGAARRAAGADGRGRRSLARLSASRRTRSRPGASSWPSWSACAMPASPSTTRRPSSASARWPPSSRDGLGPQAAVTIAAPTDRFHEAEGAFAEAVRATARDATASLLR